MKRPLRALFYGCSHEHAPGKMETLKRMKDDFELVAVADDSARRSPTYFTEPFLPPAGCPIVSEVEALSIRDIDCVFIEVANRNLMEIAKVYAERGVPMHCDKPCGESMGAYREVTEICRARRVPMQIGYMYRANPAIRFMRRAVKEGWIGKVVFAEADMNHAYGNDDYQHYVGTMTGGILYNLGCHLVDTLVPFLDGDPVRATCVKGTAPGDTPDCLNRMTSLVEFPAAEMLIRSCSRAPGGIICRRIRLDGTKGTFDLCPIERFDGGELKLAMTLAESAGGYASGCHEISLGVQTDRYAGQLKELAAIVRREIPDTTDFDHDLKVHDITLMASGVVSA